MSDRTEATTRLRRLALVGHDMRSALADIVGGLDMIEEAQLDSASLVQLERVRAAGEILHRLVDDAVATLAGEPLPGSERASRLGIRESLALDDLLRDLERRWTGHAAAAGLRLETDRAPDLPAKIGVAPVPLERLLGNLLDNALKYAERGPVRLAVDLDEEDGLRFAVTDDGPGFSEQSLERLFGFGGRPPSSRRPGTGMGLHIAKSLADLMGGHLEAGNDAERGGARVRFVLPAEAWRPEGPSEDAGAQLPDLSGRHALVADDVPTNRILIARMLARLGATCDEAADGREALAALTRGGYDLAILDVQMPTLAGPDVIAGIRALPAPHGRVPILAMTAYALRQDRERIYAAGADGLIAKPIVSIAALGEAIARLGHGTPGTPERPERPASGDGAAPRLAHLVEIAGPEGAVALLDRLYADLDRTSTALADAVEARDAAGLRAASHVLIALTGAIGADGLQDAMEAANAAAQGDDWEGIARLLETVRPRLRAVRDEVAAARAALPAEAILDARAAP